MEIEVFGKYVDPKKFRILPASFLRPENVNAVTQQLAELGQQAAAAGPNQVLIANAIAIILTDLRQKKAPEAYMGYALYDADSNMYESGKILLSKKARNKHEELNRKLYISKDGYMEAFLVNETSENVWFDQFRIETTTPVILQETHYDPWGVELQGLGYQEPGSKVNKYLYNGKEFNDHQGLNLFDYGARMYDASVGRWFTVDPLAELPSQIAHSPYVYAWNNPVGMIDPTGMAAEESDPGKEKTYRAKDDLPVFTLQPEPDYPDLGQINKSNQNAQAGWGGGIGTSVSTGISNVSDFGRGFANGFGGGVGQTWDFVKSLGTTEGWENLGNGMVDFANLACTTCPVGMMMRIQMTNQTVSYIQNIPNMSLYELGYDFGYGSEKALEIAVTRRVALSFKIYPNARGFGFDFKYIRFDAHKFRLGGRKTGYDVWRPHIDIPSRGIKHWPWHQIDKWRRGVN